MTLREQQSFTVYGSAMAKYTLQVNDRAYQVEAEADMPLLWVLRDLLQLTGTKYGCGIGVCGACTVHEDGLAVRSCQITIANAVGRKYTSIEGLSAKGDHPCQRAWIEEDVSQCGYCQAGMVMAAAALLLDKPHPGDADIDAVMSEHPSSILADRCRRRTHFGDRCTGICCSRRLSGLRTQCLHPDTSR